MKFNYSKLAGATASTITALSLATPAFATINLDPCANMTEPWNGLCAINSNNIPTIIGNAVLLLFVVAALIALFFLIWGGIKWILSGGDKGKVETARSTIIAAVIGLIVTFLAFFVLQFVLGLFGIDLMNLEIPDLVS